MIRNIRTQSDYKSTIVRNQLTSLVLYESIKTTDRKARFLIPFANRFFSKAKERNLNSIRYVQSILFDPNAVKKVFEDIMPRYSTSDTTFVRSYKTVPRKGDNAEQVLVSLIKPLVVELETKTKSNKKQKNKIEESSANDK